MNAHETTYSETLPQKRESIVKRFKKAFRKEIPFAIGSPAIVWQVLFFYLPFLLMLVISVYDQSAPAYITFKHYLPLFNSTYANVIWGSFSLAFFTAILCFILGFPLAYFLAFKVKRVKSLLLFLLIIPFWTNFLLHIYAWFFVLEREGFLNQMLLYSGLIDTPIHFLNTPFAVSIMMVYYYLPFMVLPIYFSLERFDRSYIEASYDLGASYAQTFRRVLLPISLSAVRGGFLLVFIPAFGEFIIPELMGGDKQYYVGSVISQFILGQTTVPIGMAFTALSIALLLCSAAGLYGCFSMLNKFLIRGAR